VIYNFTAMRMILVVMLLGMCSCASNDQKALAKEEKAQVTKPFAELYDNGQVKIKGNLLDDQRHGRWESFYENGVKWSEDNYYQGEKNGRTVSYYPTGMFRYQGTYIDDIEAGKWTFYDEEGNIIKEMDYSEK